MATSQTIIDSPNYLFNHPFRIAAFRVCLLESTLSILLDLEFLFLNALKANGE